MDTAEQPMLKRYRLLFLVLAYVAALSCLKVAIHWFGLEFLALNTLFLSAIGGAVFIVGFLLSGVMTDYKEAERIPADIRVALEAIHDDSHVFRKRTQHDHSQVSKILTSICTDLHSLLSEKKKGDLKPVIAHIDGLTDVFEKMEAAGLPPNFVVKLKAEQSTLRRCVFRIYHVRRIQFVPSAHVLVQTLVGVVVMLLLFLKTEGSPESALIFGALSYMFIYALRLVDTLEQPLRKSRESLDDVSLFLLRVFCEKVRDEAGLNGAEGTGKA